MTAIDSTFWTVLDLEDLVHLQSERDGKREEVYGREVRFPKSNTKNKIQQVSTNEEAYGANDAANTGPAEEEDAAFSHAVVPRSADPGAKPEARAAPGFTQSGSPSIIACTLADVKEYRYHVLNAVRSI